MIMLHFRRDLLYIFLPISTQGYFRINVFKSVSIPKLVLDIKRLRKLPKNLHRTYTFGEELYVYQLREYKVLFVIR